MEITKHKPEKSLTKSLQYRAGRDNKGHVAIRHRGGRHKRLYRELDFKRDKYGIAGKIAAIEYDPNRASRIALIYYEDGEKRDILAPAGIEVGSVVQSGPDAEIKNGNALPLKNIPIGKEVHNVELAPGQGAKLVRGAGGAALIAAHEKKYIKLKLPSGELRLVHEDCYATIGQVSREEFKNETLGKAGRKRWLGIRPTVRGVAQHPGSHPHGGGEGRSGIGMPSPKSPWGKKTLGKKTRNPNKHSRKFIVVDRRKK